MKLMEKNEIGHCGEIEIVKNRFDHCGEIIKKFKFWEYLRPLLRLKFKFLTDNAITLWKERTWSCSLKSLASSAILARSAILMRSRSLKIGNNLPNG